MNKKFFTLMAAILVGGAAMPSDAFAQKVEFSSLAHADSMIALSDGVKFYMGKARTTDTVAYAVRDSAGYSVLGYCDNKLHVAADTVSVFEVRNYSKADKTFELWVNGKQFVHTNGSNVYKKFYGVKDWKPTEAADSTNIGKIFTAQIGTSGEDAFQGSDVFPMSSRQKHSAKTLNAYLNPGVKLSYPDVQNLVSNPFGETMIALDPRNTELAGTVFAGSSTAVSDSVVFVKKDAAYNEYAKIALTGTNAQRAEKFKALSVAVVDPYDTYSITGLSGVQGRVIKFVKGEALAEANDQRNGLVNKTNARFVMAEGDMLNEYGYLSMEGSIAIGTDAPALAYIGAYSLTTTGDSRSYVTTYTSTAPLTWAQVGAGTYANVATLLKADGPAVYNIQFTGERPAAGSSITYYGKYFVVTASGAQGAEVPNKVDVTNAAAQWIVKSVGAKGRVTLLNKADLSTTKDFTLYATDEANVFELQTPMSAGDGTHVQFIPVAEDNTFVELTDAQLAEEAQIVFNGSNAIAVNNINVTNDGGEFKGTQMNSSTTFNLAKAELVKKGYTYALTNGGEILSKTDSVAAQSYLLTSGGLGVYINRRPRVMSINNNSGRESLKFVFKNDLAGKLQAIALPYKYGADSTYTNRIVDASVLYVNPANAYVDTTAHTTSADYNHVTLNFSAAKGNSLPAVCKHVYFNGTNASGSISFNETANGLLEGTLATTPMVFWLDTANSDQLTPAFYISKALPNDEDEMRAVATEPDRMMLFNPKNYLQEWNPGTASYVKRDELYLTGTAAKAIFAPAAITGVNKLIWYNEDGDVARVPAKDVECFKFTITEKDGAYVISNGNEYLYSLNGKLGFTTNKNEALVVEVEKTTVTANDGIEAEAGVQVIAGQGVVTVQGAAGKVVTVSNILGQTIANQVAASDNVTIAAPAGVVVVTVDGEATKVIVK